MLLTAIITALAICIAATWLYSGLFLTLLAENRRFWKVHRQKPAPFAHTYARANIIIPCKGMEHQLRENLQAFMHQDHPNYEVTFVVERGTDSAVNLIRNLQKENRCVRSKLIIAGRAEDCGQKVHNLRVAVSQLNDETDVLVFADSDASPKSTWLRWLVNRIGRENLGARTGYRWMVPCNNSLPTLIGVSINNAVASFMGRGRHFLVWGGSWAVHRRVFDAVGIEQAWKNAISDDLVASRALKYAKLGIEFEPQCVCTSRVSFTWSSLIEFMRRQFLITRIHATRYWFVALIVTLISQVGFWGGLIGGAFLLATGNSLGYWAIGSSVLLYCTGCLRASIRQNIGRGIFPAWRNFRHARKFDLFAGPLVGLVTLLLIGCSAFGRTIGWRNIRYHIGQLGSTTIVGRKLDQSKWPVNTTEAAAPAKAIVEKTKTISSEKTDAAVAENSVPAPKFASQPKADVADVANDSDSGGNTDTVSDEKVA
jgi:hypothetical protein